VPEFGTETRVVFSDDRLLLEVMSFRKRPDVRNPRPWVTAVPAAGAAALAVRYALRRRALA
jgi:hypothetical protein